ncbi:glycerol-3-phosphate dehydrogenase (NAD+) [Hyphomicrobium sp. GJ21]|uniref:NAD(P)H-dependent glycerol-3-phosphate dehydrogenase n=1 Tax=Hyphomicrobium sp. GJ21 TaxID=113574 RepID=UPI000622B799|nr:NAD(P)H-dependent glycerol-3-phosphate dehydrogenase [Hyphomicrobium sp. GJ21]CEJ83630.1 glycerol-3-phosphate dehydrogenase (NAD+) [Hyphomicrobium sp. GJ21]
MGDAFLQLRSISIIGGGAWGTALAQTLSYNDANVTLWAREPEIVEDINARHVNRVFLPGVDLNVSIRATGDLAKVAAADAILAVAPAQHLRAVLSDLARHLPNGVPIVICSKGIEQATGKFMGDVLEEVVPQATRAVLSGPSFAADVARGLPSALTLACRNEAVGRALTASLSSRQMRLYWSSDVLGAELGGSVKNVLAIAAGIVEGRGLGTSAHAAIVTRGFAELRRFGDVMGARPETLLGLSGLGDLILTCGSAQSRNMSLGRGLGEGRTLSEILGGRSAVTEGVYTAAALVGLARSKAVEMPIAEAVHEIIEGRLGVDEAIAGLMQRPLKAED